MTRILEAMDELNRARDLARLIAMTARHTPDDDPQAIAAGCDAIEERFEAAFQLLGMEKGRDDRGCTSQKVH